ncbi:methyltransferase-like protein 27 [Cebidichthys violaceus]|uniref:methyltransferase-like protein 27 n=1 Tax=Cebidichthys violaceus TaxID=271503 RepID=UPI0035CB46B7
MSSSQRSMESVKEVVSALRGKTSFGEKMEFYDTWAHNYDQDLVVLGYNMSSHVAESVSSRFCGDREAAVVLDVACGTGLVAEKMKRDGFRHFVGVDGNQAMLKEAQRKELYRDLKQCFLGDEPLPVPEGSCDLVVMCGALSVDNVGVQVLRRLWVLCKPGGLVCMTCRHSPENQDYRASLEEELRTMEDQSLWTRETVTQVESWFRAQETRGEEGRDHGGSVYLYRKL